MGKIIIQGGGVNLEEVTALPGDIIKGKTAYTKGSDDPTTGLLELAGNAQAAHVLAGEAFYTTDPKVKQTGTMTVNSILSFSAQAYSGRQILLKWQNPYAATGKPLSGVHVWYSTGGYPGAGGGTWIYSGYGGNAASGGWCQAIVTLPALNATYYFTACSYATCSAGDMWGSTFNAAAATGTDLWLTITGSQNYTIPSGYGMADLFAVGGGSGGKRGGGGGGSGYTQTATGIAVSTGQVLSMIIGGGGSSNSAGGTSSVVRSGVTLITANGGGSGGISINMSTGVSGGSGGGTSGYVHSGYYNGGNGGADGGNGASVQGYAPGGGQGRTTRGWGSASGTLYAGGGGGGGDGYLSKYTGGGAGGAGGGGAGGVGGYRWEQDDTWYYSAGTPGSNGAANAGGGGGGGGYSWYDSKAPHGSGGNGGSGIILMHLY